MFSAVMVMVSACNDSSTDSTTACTQAVSRYYAAGCSYNRGAAVSETDAEGACESLSAGVTSGTAGGTPQQIATCKLTFNSWLQCNNSGGCSCEADFDFLESNCG